MRENWSFAHAKTKAQISCAVTAQLISAFVFAKRTVKFLFYLYPKFQASSLTLSLYMTVFVGPGLKPQSPVFMRCGSYASLDASVRILLIHISQSVLLSCRTWSAVSSRTHQMLLLHRIRNPEITGNICVFNN